jgi:hypothetical protein
MAESLGQGQGTATAFKERGFGAAFRVSMNLSNGKNVARFPYWHIDLNSGSGRNEDARCDGSPIVFLEMAAQHRPNFKAFFCDHDLKAIEALSARVGSTAYCFGCDNREILAVVSAAIAKAERNPSYSVGTVVCDPNGYTGDAMPHEEIAQFAQRHERIDLIFNLNVSTYQWMKGNIRLRRKGWESKFCPSIREFPAMFHRRHWLISEIRSPGRGHRFVILIGRNFPTDGHRSMGHYRFESIDGERILQEFEGAAQRANPLGTLPQLPGLSEASGLPGSPTGGDDVGRLAVRPVRRKSDRGPSQGVLPLGDV